MKYFVVTVMFVGALTQEFPSYIKSCSFQSPDFQKCALEHANDAIPYIVKGDKRVGIPKLDPLKLPLIDVEQNNFKLSLKDVDIMGLKNIKATTLHIDHDSFDAIFHIDLLNIIGTHKIDGKVLLLTLKGEGPANITAVEGDYHVKSTLSRISKNGQDYLKFGKPTVDFTLKRAYFNFGNLLGNDQLGSEINNILNENWQDFLKDVGSPIKETISTIIESIVSNILDKYPEAQILPP